MKGEPTRARDLRNPLSRRLGSPLGRDAGSARRLRTAGRGVDGGRRRARRAAPAERGRCAGGAVRQRGGARARYGCPTRRPGDAVRRARYPASRPRRHSRRGPPPAGLPAVGRGMPIPLARRLCLRRVERPDAHRVLRPGPYRRAALLLLPDAGGLRLRQRRGSRPGRAVRLRRAGRDHGRHVSYAHQSDHAYPHVLSGGAQAAAGSRAHRELRRPRRGAVTA